MAIPLGVAGALGLLFLGALVHQGVVAPLVASAAPVIEVPPPPPRSEPDETYLVRPRPSYPAVANLRGQCGWVRLRLRIDGRGLVHACQVVEQAPGRVFEKAILQALGHARFASGRPREGTALVIFVSEGDHTPDWAVERLAAAAPPP
ncbi:TonB family protein [Phenylobacterium aquaticum]|uniref:TonB family protein n=1 Tax=Phenylobacterium aquaticum TaxID=1763816 RepID=UPI001F5E1D4F|nr:TonB family protein [Phenylobacterium aquaticum]MCI3131962.1 energy transducer TonB [Phenylobacterium aquaticum]